MNRIHLFLSDIFAVASALALIIAYIACAVWEVVIVGDETGEDI